MPKPQKRMSTKQKNKAKKNKAISEINRIGRLPDNPKELLRHSREVNKYFTMEAAEIKADGKMMMEIKKLKKLHPRISDNRQVNLYWANKVRQAMHEAGDFNSRPRAFKRLKLKTKRKLVDKESILSALRNSKSLLEINDLLVFLKEIYPEDYKKINDILAILKERYPKNYKKIVENFAEILGELRREEAEKDFWPWFRQMNIIRNKKK